MIAADCDDGDAVVESAGQFEDEIALIKWQNYKQTEWAVLMTGNMMPL